MRVHCFHCTALVPARELLYNLGPFHACVHLDLSEPLLTTFSGIYCPLNGRLQHHVFLLVNSLSHACAPFHVGPRIHHPLSLISEQYSNPYVLQVVVMDALAVRLAAGNARSMEVFQTDMPKEVPLQRWDIDNAAITRLNGRLPTRFAAFMQGPSD